MRPIILAGLLIALGTSPGLAESRRIATCTQTADEDTCSTAGRAGPSKARTEHARRMVNAMDDYDAQIARREKQLKKEMRDMERASRQR